MGRIADYLAARAPEWTRAGWRRVSGTAAWQLVSRTVRDSWADRVPGLAAEVAFFALLSLPALLLMLLGSLGFIAAALGPDGTAELHRLAFEVPRTFLTERTYESYARVARRVLEEGRADVVSLGAVLSLWTGSRVVARLIDTVTIAYDLEEPRPIWRRRLLALQMTLGGLLSGIVVLPAMVLGPQLVGLVAPRAFEEATVGLVDVLFWPGMGLLALVVLAWLYHAAAPWDTPWRRDLPGAALALLIWVLSAVALRIYIITSVNSDGLFAQLATPLAVVLWLYVTAFAVLLGAELNAEIEKMWPHRDFPWRLKRQSKPGKMPS